MSNCKYDEEGNLSGDYLEYMAEKHSERIQKAIDDFYEWEGHY